MIFGVDPHVPAVHARAGTIDDLHGAERRLERFGEPHLQLCWRGRCGDRSADGRIGAFDPGMRGDFGRDRRHRSEGQQRYQE